MTILDLRGVHPPVLHRPRLAALACLLFALSNFFQIITALLQIIIPQTTFRSSILHNRLCTIAIIVSGALIVAATMTLKAANLARHADPPRSPWPLRLLLLFACFYALCHITAELSMRPFHHFGRFSFGAEEVEHRYRYFYLPIFIAALAFASAAYFFAFLYALQIAAFIRDATLCVASTLILAPALLVLLIQTFFTANFLANRLGRGIHLPKFPLLETLWAIVQVILALTLILFTLLLAHRLYKRK